MQDDFSQQPSTPPPPPPPQFSGYGSPATSYSYTPGSYPPVYRPGPRTNRSPWFYVAAIGGSFAAICLVFGCMFWFMMRSIRDGGSAGLGLPTDRIAVIDIEGVIFSPETVDAQLRKF